MEQLNNSILQVLKCPCCSQPMRQAIYICITGHSLCNTCWKIGTCPICKVPLSDSRNFSLEIISSLAYYPCENEANGCQECYQLEELSEHLTQCDYRDYSCRAEGCQWRGRRTLLKKHYIDDHAGSVLIGNECICFWTPEKPNYTAYFMMALDEMFYVHVKLRDNIFYWIVQYIGRPEDIVIFGYEVEIFSNEYNDRKLEFSEICHDDLQEDIDEIIESGFCVAVPLSNLQTYMNPEGAVFYKVVVKKV